MCLSFPIQEDTMEETGWKLVHGDVFRPPKNKQLLSALLGAGVQIFFMSMITIGKKTTSQSKQPIAENTSARMSVRLNWFSCPNEGL